MWAYGGCATRTWPERTLADARARAEADGWYLKDRDLCPHHAGSRR
jgi:hypothetical protein